MNLYPHPAGICPDPMRDPQEEFARAAEMLHLQPGDIEANQKKIRKQAKRNRKAQMEQLASGKGALTSPHRDMR